MTPHATTAPDRAPSPPTPAPPQPARKRRPRRGAVLGSAALTLATMIVTGLCVQTARTVTEPTVVAGTARPNPADVLTPVEATDRTCASFAAALDAIAPLQVLLPSGWSPADLGIDDRLRTYTDAMTKAALSIQIDPATAPTVKAAVTDWVTTVLIGDQVILRKAQQVLSSELGPRLDAAELISRSACGL
ncbi:hypothetical protein OG921_24200 [Aldersonia sp. NBC_00410]|uniref:hypothetical protein n=1 Tax=Aldersonia sp. NBC_00410 TaxID=2975954 RepID=UPI002254976A|nr:hypothetical protein [Aldersonia sp. NBC_00410]MCX5046278.1 hypothetical protein [Aldersonia sp. NBC_00410]